MDRHYLALDLGAESGRAMLAKLRDGRIELTEVHRFSNSAVRLPSGLYWDSLHLFEEICRGIRMAAEHGAEPEAIGIDTWGVDFALIGSNGELLQNPRHYRDNRTKGISREVFETVPRAEIFRHTGIQFMEINSLYQLYAIRRDSPLILDAAAKLLFMPDLFNFFLTGTYASERSIASTSQFYDPVKKSFATDMLRRLGIAGGFLATLVDPGAELGPLLPHVAEHCKLKREVPVYATASHDTASAVAAVPSLDRENWCYISSGTWSLMGVELDGPVIDDASLEANFTNETGVAGKIRFLKNIPGLWLLQECRRAWAKRGREYSYAELMERAAAAKPLDVTLDLDEFNEPGRLPEKICEYCRKTSQAVPSDEGSMTRVILESLAARYAQVLDSIEAITKRKVEVIHIVGGGSKNALLNQLAADKTGRRVIAGPAEATAAGNALIQAMGTGDIGSLEELRAIVRQSFELEEFRPSAQ